MNPVLFIVGPTATGKSDVAIRVAQQIGGEIISADSMQIYRGMDIGTAKIPPEERQGVPHHLIDVVDPDTPFTVVDYQKLALETIENVSQRGMRAIVVGGTGLYVKSLTHGLDFSPAGEDPGYRQELRARAAREGPETLHRLLAEVDPETARRLHPHDVRRVIRALEIYHLTGLPMSHAAGRRGSRIPFLMFGLTMERAALYRRINDRVIQMVKQGWVQEVQRLLERGYSRNLTSMQAIGYKELADYLAGEMTLDEAIERIQRGTRRYAKRQWSWFRAQPVHQWLDVGGISLEEAGRKIAEAIGGRKGFRKA
ncbi:tRNA (adenosine(37)-N6)-dimethylallyltransferase MiaA [Kyrpidia spormannii]|uniref:tRNA isopentenylpyrophosphate transferase n=2 Tax=Kyrpidia spormannii TaxID=2055160 RepID=A0ACA8Z9K2_9BACL|nr:tRNA (adenosine(37)-N6)-dimethylallyltransferase MiaA [Kyrpidia spormannii]CAB3392266.1 tRNA isopentenylpyrophosphate transferase [Kyrpidia spormannii]CAB3393188.1 tRNA isopentenylpyrophosphate transferase [Kyrpidia spormannii]